MTQPLSRQLSRKLSIATLRAFGALGILWGSVSWLTQAPGAIAQVNSADSGCYMHSASGVYFDLAALCPGFDPAQFSSPAAFPASESHSSPTASAQVGDLQITLRWEGSADLDLLVGEPIGNSRIHANQPTAASGGYLDKDANGNCQASSGSAAETIAWPAHGVATGSYRINVAMDSTCGQQDPVPFTITVRVNGETISKSDVMKADEDIGFEFFDDLNYYILIPEAGDETPIAIKTLDELLEELETLGAEFDAAIEGAAIE
ncbi:MAG: hypothetical protein ACFB16_22810 [Phormidesmis sp.]